MNREQWLTKIEILRSELAVLLAQLRECISKQVDVEAEIDKKHRQIFDLDREYRAGLAREKIPGGGE